MTLTKTAGLYALTLALVAAPAIAPAQSGYDERRAPARHVAYRGYDRDHRTCGAVKRAHGNNGTAIGAVAGGVLGSAMGHGKLGNILLGAGAGAVAGHVVGRSTARC